MQAKCDINTSYLRKFPSVATVGALAKRRHRLISTPRLRLTVADFLLATFSAGQTRADALLHLCYHSLIHILFLQSRILGSALSRLQLFVSHCDKPFGSDFARKDSPPQLWV